MTDLKNAVLTVLLGIQANGPRDSKNGICGNIADYLMSKSISFTDGELDAVLDPLFDSWPEKSHSAAYPVGKWSKTPSSLFWFHYDNQRSMWDVDTRYGKARWNLLYHMIQELNK